MTEQCKFFVPGPTWVRPEIRQELARPVIGHRSNEFKQLFRAIREDLKTLFATKQETFVITASGTGVMQAALENCVARRVLVTSCGAFSDRWFKIAESLGLEADRLEAGWGNAINPDALADHLASRRAQYDAVTLTYNETSTGVTNDIAILASVVREESPESLVLVDAVSALGGLPVEFDQWNLDVCLASVQKGLALPPGITVVAVSDGAIERAKKNPYRGTYFDFL
ncbi:MAG TPA: aminotransferase class V-fold PLP-dependent enzyme, partial [Thermoanaerobaculia bacterium]|nr:aminotransferase class V-fold PLP-dependent enzyme [Thermoanaerobaculia bacterium]